jgi:DNA modification methylase
MEVNKTYNENCLTGMERIPDKFIQTCITSPPYFGLRDYGTPPQLWPAVTFEILGFEISIPEMVCSLGLEPTPNAFIGHLVLVFRQVKRCMRDDGTLWLNIGDSYAGNGQRTAGTKAKDLIGVPWMLAFALRADGWYLRQDIIWSKPNPMPESVTDRCTKAHEYLFLFSKQPKYYYDAEAIKTDIKDSTAERMAQQIDAQKGSARVPGKTNGNMKAVGAGRPFGIIRDRLLDYNSKEKELRPNTKRGGVENEKDLPPSSGKANKKSVWTVTTKPFTDAHFATFPPDLITDCIKAGSRENDVLLDPFGGSGTTKEVARKLNRNAILFELSTDYLKIDEKRMHKNLGLFK